MAWSVATACAQPSKITPANDRPALGGASQEEGARILAEFRRAGIAGDYWLAFELRVMPRKGAERNLTGTLIGTSGPAGPLSRLQVADRQWLFASGAQPYAWSAAGMGGEAARATPTEAIAGTGITLFDLQMPFLYWQDFVYEGQARVRGRPTHSFILRPPGGYEGIAGVRVLIDTQFQKPVQTEQLGANDVVEKTIALLDLKKVGDQWLVKSIDVRDHRTRDKTRLEVTAAALNLVWPDTTFTPAGLGQAVPAAPPAQVVRF